jgi:protoporphyrinogen oxidase
MSTTRPDPEPFPASMAWPLDNPVSRIQARRLLRRLPIRSGTRVHDAGARRDPAWPRWSRPAEAGTDGSVRRRAGPVRIPAVMKRRPTVAIVGGGISGLATAWFMNGLGAAHVVLLEAGPRLGGKLRTVPLAGLPLESGPDGFLPGVPAVALCEEIGLGPDLVEARTTEAYVWTGGELRRLAAQDSPGGAAPQRLLTMRGGLASLVEALESRLTGVDVRCGAEVADVQPAADGTFLLAMRSAPPVTVDRLVLAIPAPASARLLARVAPDVAAMLAGIRYLDMAVINLVYPGRPWRLPGSGFLASEGAGLLISGCTWLTAKWPHLASSDLTAIRVTVGGRGDADWTSIDDAALIARAHEELCSVVGAGPPPCEAQVVRWQPALADPRCLDRELVRAAQRAAGEAGVLLAAGGYLGGGVASCIAEAAIVAGEACTPRADQEHTGVRTGRSPAT